MKTRILRAAALGLGLLAAACGRDDGQGSENLAPVVAASAVALDVPIELLASGELEARDETRIAAEISGRVTEVVVDEAGAVAAGSVVLEIDTQRRRLELDTALARVAQAEASLERQRRQTERVRNLFRSNVASKAELDEAETALRLASAQGDAERAQRGVAERALDDASVQAPFAGLVAHRHVNVGEFVQPGTALFDLVSLDPIEVVFHLPEIDSARVALGQPVEVSVAPFPGEVFRGEVTVIAPTIDPATRTLRIKAQVPNADGRLRPGLFAHASLGVELRRGLVMVPEEALRLQRDGQVLFSLDAQNRVRRLVVETGVTHDGWIEVRGSVASGDRVVRRGQDGLVEGQSVALRESDGGPVPTEVVEGVKRERGL